MIAVPSAAGRMPKHRAFATLVVRARVALGSGGSSGGGGRQWDFRDLKEVVVASGGRLRLLLLFFGTDTSMKL